MYIAVICYEADSDRYPYLNGTVSFLAEDRFNLFLGENGNDWQSLYDIYDDNTMNFNQFLQFTDIRISLKQPMDDGLSSGPYDSNNVKYFYSIRNIDVIAS